MAKAWFPFYFSDYTSKTEHLTLAEHGAYLLLMGSYYKTGCKLPANAKQLQRICRAFDTEEVDAMNSILDQFFEKHEDGYRHVRIEEELDKSNEISKKRSEAAQKRYKKDANTVQLHSKSNANAEVLQPHLQTQSQSQSQLQSQPHSQSHQDQNISEKNIDLPAEKKQKRKNFVPPTIEQVREYCLERKNNINPENFVDYYTANGWMRGKTKLKDWKACIRTWERNRDPKTGSQSGQGDNRSRAKRVSDKLDEIAREDIERRGGFPESLG